MVHNFLESRIEIPLTALRPCQKQFPTYENHLSILINAHASSPHNDHRSPPIERLQWLLQIPLLPVLSVDLDDLTVPLCLFNLLH